VTNGSDEIDPGPQAAHDDPVEAPEEDLNLDAGLEEVRREAQERGQ
jgi:hypothetical protein